MAVVSGVARRGQAAADGRFPDDACRYRRPRMRGRLLTGLLCAAAALHAGDEPAAVDTPWSWKVRLGVFLQSIASDNAAASRDPSIAGSVDSTTFKLSGSGNLIWHADPNRVEQRVETEYGQQRSEPGNEWTENADRILYAVTYERALTAIQLLYLNGTVESVFTGREPESRSFDPLIAKLSTGYGHRYTDLLPLHDTLIWRLGVYARKRWESHAADYQTRLATGPEALARYERKQSEDVSYAAQYECFGEFADPSHVTQLAQAGLRVQVAKLLSVELKLRAYAETRPEDAPRGEPGYDEWSFRQEALVGLAWETSSADR
jgi:hypothetical protein